MDGKSHFKWYFILMPIIFAAVFIYQLILATQWLATLCALPLLIIAFTSIDPDDDLKYREGKLHRWYLTHSILLPILLYLAIVYCPRNLLLPVLMLPVIIHLLCDFQPHGQPTGKYLIYIHGHRLSVIQTKIWYALNIIIGILLIYYLPMAVF